MYAHEVLQETTTFRSDCGGRGRRLLLLFLLLDLLPSVFFISIGTVVFVFIIGDVDIIVVFITLGSLVRRRKPSKVKLHTESSPWNHSTR